MKVRAQPASQLRPSSTAGGPGTSPGRFLPETAPGSETGSALLSRCPHCGAAGRTGEQILNALERADNGIASIRELAEGLSLKEQAVRVEVSRLRAKGHRIESFRGYRLLKGDGR